MPTTTDPLAAAGPSDLLRSIAGFLSMIEGPPAQVLRGRVDRILDELPYREREVLRLRYGLGDGFAYPLADVCRIFGTSRTWASLAKKDGLAKLQLPERLQELRRIAVDARTAYHGQSS